MTDRNPPRIILGLAGRKMGVTLGDILTNKSVNTHLIPKTGRKIFREGNFSTFHWRIVFHKPLKSLALLMVQTSVDSLTKIIYNTELK
jgi:hypothetical protein